MNQRKVNVRRKSKRKVFFNVEKRENNPECEKGGKVHHTKKRKQCQVAGSNKKFRKNIVRSDPQRQVQIQVQNL